MKKLSIAETHEVLLNIAKEFDRICTNNNIPYYMLGGTMLGAIRHKGFIPWDDDMDFGVPLPYYKKLEEILTVELPEKYRCSTYLNSKSVILPFMKIEDTTTILDDKQINLPLEEKIGINIDIFPLYYCDNKDKKINTARMWQMFAGKIFTNSRQSKIKNLLKLPLRLLCPVNYLWFIKKSRKIADSIESGEYISNIYGRWKDKETCLISWFEPPTRYEFEDTTFMGPSKYDVYLTQMYNDYMQLPPLENQFCHGENAYKKDVVD